MPNTNFQTIHQMQRAINDFVKQATGRDNVQNIDIDHVTVAQNKHFEEASASGRIVSFTTKTGGLPLETCIAQIEPVQAGSGTPSPDNVRPITGWTGVEIVVSPTTDEADGQIYSIAFPAEAGIVFGGRLDAIMGVLTMDRASEIIDGTQELGTNGILSYGGVQVVFTPTIEKKFANTTQTQNEGLLSDKFSASIAGPLSPFYLTGRSTNGRVYINMPSGITTPREARTWFADNPTQISFLIATPLTYQLTPQEIRTLTGPNNIWANTGDIEVTYKDLRELY